MPSKSVSSMLEPSKSELQNLAGLVLSKFELQSLAVLVLNKSALSRCELQSLAELVQSRCELQNPVELVQSRCGLQNPVKARNNFSVVVAGKRALALSKREPNCGIRFGPLRLPMIGRLQQKLPRRSRRKFDT